MKAHMTLLSAVPLLLMAFCAQAQQAPSPVLTVLPPPSINDPGAVPATLPAAASTASLVPRLPSMRSTDARGNSAPTVTVTRQKDNLVEQYYQGGQLYMVRVQPKHGVPYTYYVEKGHKLRRSAGAPPVNPVMFTILEWGKPASGSGGDSD